MNTLCSLDGFPVLLPAYGYKAVIKIMAETVTLGDGSVESFDYGKLNDKYECSLNWDQSEEYSQTFESIFTGNAIQTGSTFVGETSDFRPFGPHWIPEKDFYFFYVSSFKNTGKKNMFGERFRFKLRIVSSNDIQVSGGVFQDCSEGSMQLGTLMNLPYPKVIYNRSYNVTTQNTAGGTVYSVAEEEDAASEIMTFEWSLNDIDARNVVNYMVNTVRMQTVTITPASNYYFRGTGNDPFDARLYEPIIECTHMRYNRWMVKFKMAVN